MPSTNISSESTSIISHSDLEKCAEICLECYQTCNETLRYCIHQGGPHVEAEHLTLLLDCARVCHISADFLTRGSERHIKLCGICADICSECADDCRRIGDKEMIKCAEICERCARSCREMITH